MVIHQELPIPLQNIVIVGWFGKWVTLEGHNFGGSQQVIFGSLEIGVNLLYLLFSHL